MKNISTAILVALVAILAACSSDQSKTAASGAVTTAVNENRTQELDRIRTKYLGIEDAGTTSILAAAQGNEMCEAYTLYQKYIDIFAELGRSGFKSSNLEHLEERTTLAARKAAEFGYNAMVAGKPLDCGTGEGKIRPAHMIKNIADLVSTYGQTPDTKAYDPQVFRTAYLKIIKPQVVEALTALNGRPDSSDALGWVQSLVEDAGEWHITPSELGVPATVVKKLNL